MDTAVRVGSRAAVPAWVFGLAGALAALVIVPAPVVARIFLAAPLVVVPALLASLPGRPLVGPWTTRELAWPALVAGAALAFSFAVPAWPAAALALPWLGVTTLVGLAALRHGLPRLVTLFTSSRTTDLAADAALGFLAVGGIFVLVDRLGLDVMGRPAPYPLLGAIHYHFAGFGLLGLLAVLAAQRSQAWHWAATLALIGGIAAAGVGLIVDSQLISWLGVLLLAGGGSLVIAGLGRRGLRQRSWQRLGLLAAAGMLAAGLSMGVLWASASLFGFGFIGLELMVRTHGALNATAVVVAAVALAGRR
ncbi:MAG TPA: YndJ family transporter [Candidatus Limnocylindrales bacterium]